MYLTEDRVRALLTTLAELGGGGSRLAVNFGLGVEAAESRWSRPTTLASRVALALDREPVRFRSAPEDAPMLLADTGWTARRVLTAPELVRLHLTGTTMPTTGIAPTAFAVEATCA